MIELLNVDCMEYMAGLPDKAFDLAIVDPEYGINVAKRKHFGRRSAQKAPDKRKNGAGYIVKRNDYIPKDWDSKPPKIEYFNELKRVSKNQIIWGWKYFGLDWGPGLIKWDKMQPEGVSFGTFEYAYCSILDREILFKLLWAGFQQAKSLSEPTVSQGNLNRLEKRIHPTHKPVLLYKWLISEFAKKGDKILDTHGGSMSSAIACHEMGFDAVICELDPDYYQAALKRFNNAKMQQSLFID